MLNANLFHSLPKVKPKQHTTCHTHIFYTSWTFHTIHNTFTDTSPNIPHKCQKNARKRHSDGFLCLRWTFTLYFSIKALRTLILSVGISKHHFTNKNSTFQEHSPKFFLKIASGKCVNVETA